MNLRLALEMLKKGAMPGAGAAATAGKAAGGMGVAANRAGKAYMDAVTPGAINVQNALVDLIGPNKTADIGSIRARLGDFAASENALKLLQAMPAAGGLYAGTAVADAVGDATSGLTGQEVSFADNTMDLLGMGVGAYGLNRGINKLGGTTRAGAALAAGAGAGKLGVDILQGLF